MIFYLVIGVLAFALLSYCYLFSVTSRKKSNGVRTLIVMGSGGHTSEMLSHVSVLTKDYSPRAYVVADNDTISEAKVNNFEKTVPYEILKIPRSRKVKQSYFTSLFTTLYSTLFCFPIILNFKPDLLLCNGPGTCVPLCFIAYVLKKLRLCRTKIVFVESVCRVETLSLSGKILLYFADYVLVQWPELNRKYPSTVYLGRLV